MKKLMAAILAVGMAAGVVSAQEVLSRNAVGYVKVEYVKGLNLVTHQFEVLDGGGSRVVSDLFNQEDFPSGTILQKWDYTSQTYVANELKVTFPSAGWSPGTNVFEIGETIWVRIPQSAPNPTYDGIMMGEVPVDDDVRSLGGLSFAGVSFPVSVHITNIASVLDYPLKSGDIIQKWDPISQNYVQELYQTFPTVGWNPGTNTIRAGEGIIIRRPGGINDQDWEQVRPYTWPN